MIKRDLRIPSSTPGIELHVHSRTVDIVGERPTVLMSHGFTVDGTESHRMFLSLAAAYNVAGFNTVLFDHRGCGYSDGRFEEFDFSSAVSDIKAVANWVAAEFQGRARALVVHGQSLGTAIAAVAFGDAERAQAFVLWNLSAEIYDRYLAMLGPEILESGLACVRDKGYFVSRAFLEDAKRYDIVSYFRNWRAPVLFVNSGADTVGNPRFAKDAAAEVGPIATSIVIAGAHHSFRCQPELEREAINASVSWVRRLIATEKTA